MFFYEKWDVFKVAVRLREIAAELSKYQVPGSADDLHQLRRSTSSMVFNIAEGAKEIHPGKKVDRYATARGSAGEANATLIVLAYSFPRSAAKLIAEGRELADCAAAMLTNLIRSVQQNWRAPRHEIPPPS